MKIYWTCPFKKCTHPREETSHLVPAVPHVHNGQTYQLNSFKKEKAKPDSIKKLKRDVWDLFSEWVRRSEANDQGFVQCVTCKKWLPWKDAQAGHYIHGTLFLIPEIVHSQCPVCNGYKNGNLILYKEFMLKKYSQQELDKFEYLASRPHEYSLFELQQFKKLYQQKLEELN